jgi:thiamine-phosphate pyrophosphorylase
VASSPKPPSATLHAIADVDVAAAAGWPPRDLIKAFLDGGASLIQLRAKRLSSGAFLELCDAAVALSASYGAAIVVNDRADLARMSGAAGVHVGQDDLPPADARAIVGAGAIVGFSTHTDSQIDAAVAQPVDYVAVGPVFGTRTKETGYDAVGVPLVAAAVTRARGRPIIAIGGITLDRAPVVMAAGAAGLAVISDLLAGNDPAARVAAYLRTIRQV